MWFLNVLSGMEVWRSVAKGIPLKALKNRNCDVFQEAEAATLQPGRKRNADSPMIDIGREEG